MEDVNKRTLSFGNTKIDYDSYMDSIASDVDNYVNRLPWSNKRKLLFMEAYTALARNLDAFDNTDGRYSVRTFEDPNLNPNLSDKKGQEMLGEAAYYMIDKAKRASKIEDKKEADKPIYDYNTHLNNGIGAYIRDHIFGGRQFSVDDEWLKLDSVDTNTKTRNITNRKNILADILDLYADSFDGTKYNFEGSPYAGSDDVKKRLKDVAAKLRSTDTIDESTKLALNSIGIDPEKWFALKSNAELQAEAAASLLSGGTQLTTQQDNTVNGLNENSSEEGLSTKVATSRRDLNPSENMDSFFGNLNNKYGTGEEAFNKMNARIVLLIEQAYNNGANKGNLTNNERTELGNLIKYVRSTNPKYKDKVGISDEELEQFSLDVSNEGLTLLPWKTKDGTNAYISADGKRIFFAKTKNAVLNTNNINSGDYNKFKEDFLKDTIMKGNIRHAILGDNDKLDFGDYFRWGTDYSADMNMIRSLGLDAASLVAAFVPVAGTVGSAITGLGATAFSTIADILNKDFSLGRTGFRLGMDLAGLIPFLNIPATAGKMAKTIGTGLPWLLRIAGSAMAVANYPHAKTGLQKMVNGKYFDITKEELQAIIGLTASAAGAARYGKSKWDKHQIQAGTSKYYHGDSLKVPEKFSVKIGDKSYNLTKEEYETLKGNGTRKAKEDVIKSVYSKEHGEEISEETLKGVFGKTKKEFTLGRKEGTKVKNLDHQNASNERVTVKNKDNSELHWYDVGPKIMNREFKGLFTFPGMKGVRQYFRGVPESERYGGSRTTATPEVSTPKPKSVTLPNTPRSAPTTFSKSESSALSEELKFITGKAKRSSEVKEVEKLFKRAIGSKRTKPFEDADPGEKTVKIGSLTGKVKYDKTTGNLVLTETGKTTSIPLVDGGPAGKTFNEMKKHAALKFMNDYYRATTNENRKLIAANIYELAKAGFFKREGGKIENFIRKKYEKGNI